MEVKPIMPYYPGDIFILPDNHETIVMEVNDNGWPIKVKSLEPDPQLGKVGWFMEGEDWVIFQMDILGGPANN